MTASRLFRSGLSTIALLAVMPAAAQQPGGEWFVPGQGQAQTPGGARPGGGSPSPARPGQAPAQAQGQPAQGRPPAARPASPAALPAGQPPPPAVIGIVDIPEIQRVSVVFNQVREEIERRRAKLNEDLQREQNAWREQQAALANQRATMQPDALRQRERDLQDRITDSQRIFRERSRAIEQAAQAALVEIETALGGIIRQVAASRQVNLVLPRPLVIFNDPPFDLTEEVAAQFNRALRSVTIPPEPTGEPTAANAPQAAPARPPTPPAQQQGQRR